MSTMDYKNDYSIYPRKYIMSTRKRTSRKQSIRKTRKRIFDNKDYNSGDGMLTYVWGPALWHSLHTISFNYPVHPTEKEKKEYRKWVLGLKNVLPCRYCRENLKKNMKKLPLTMERMASRETFSRYMYELHEHINTMLNKKSGLSYEDVRERYEHFRARCFQDKEVPKHASTHESGCITPMYGKKSKCVLSIVPLDSKKQTFTIDKSCERTRVKE